MLLSDQSKLKSLEPIHMIGIGGSGMAPLAELCAGGGLKVSGSDTGIAKNHTLRAKGIVVFDSHDAAQLEGCKTVIYSSAIGTDNVELAFARGCGKKILHRSELLGLLLESHRGIAVAGTHGKTTTTSMIGHVLTALGCDPSVVAGASIHSLGGASRNGHSDLLVIEADESDGSFLNYQPWLGIVTNIDLDHLDFYKDEAGLCRGFQNFVSGIQESGWAVLGWDCPRTRELGNAMTTQKLTYGMRVGCDVRALNIQPEPGAIRFQAVVERDLVDCRLLIPGRHNVQNALCAMAVGRCLGLSAKLVADAISAFEGVHRRLEVIFDSPSFKIIDDYAHNPGKISAAIQSVVESWPHLPVRVVFQPHRFSRLSTLYWEFARSFAGATEVIVAPIFAAGEPIDDRLSIFKLAGDIERESKVSAIAKSSLGDTIKYLSDTKNRGQIVITLGAGDVNTVAIDLKEQLLAEEGKSITQHPEAEKKKVSKPPIS